MTLLDSYDYNAYRSDHPLNHFLSLSLEGGNSPSSVNMANQVVFKGLSSDQTNVVDVAGFVKLFPSLHQNVGISEHG